MKNFIKKMGFRFLIAVFFIFLFSYKLNSIPTNISGDETIYLNSTYQTMFSPQTISPFLLMEDHTKTALNFYWMGLWIKIFGLNNAIFGMRFSIALAGVGALLAFFELLKKKTNPSISFLMTILLGTSIWFTNFARSGWLNLVAVFFGLVMIYFFEKAIEEQKIKMFFLSGILGALCCYSYLSGYIFPISAFVFLILYIIFNKNKRKALKQTLWYAFGFIPIVLPVAIMAALMRQDYLLRPEVVFVFQNTKDFVPLFLRQLTDVLDGLLLLNGTSIGKGIENLRYYPGGLPAVDPFVKILFLSGIIYFLYKFFRKPGISIWPIIYIITIGTVGILTVDSPNLARAIPVLPYIYLLSGILLYKILIFLKKRGYYKITFLTLAILIIFVSCNNIINYFTWAKADETAYYRQPAISYKEFPIWQDYQISLIKSGQRPIVNQEWYQIRDSLLRTN